jgi:glutamyl-tRNA(Gln) amidotransferase subunit E
MYPETDIPPTSITSDFIESVRSNLPEPAEKRFMRLTKQYHLNRKLASQTVNSEYRELFEEIAKSSGVAATTVAVFLTETLKSLKRDGVEVEKVSEDQIVDIFEGVGSKQIAKEALADVFVWFSQNENKRLDDAVDALGLKMLSKAELSKIVDQVISTNRQQINRLGKNAFGMFMGLIMKDVRGKADPELIKEILKERLSRNCT